MRNVHDITDVLDRTYESLRKADYAALSALTAATEAALADLQAIDADTLHRLKTLALRNAECLKASLKGVRAARRRVEEVLAADRKLVTYGQNGQRETVALARASLAQRL